MLDKEGYVSIGFNKVLTMPIVNRRISTNQAVRINVLKTGPNRPVTVPVQFGQLDRIRIELGSDRLNQRSNRRTR